MLNDIDHIHPEPVNMILFGRRVCRYNQIKMRSYWIRVALIQRPVFVSRRQFEHSRCTEGRQCEIQKGNRVKTEADAECCSISQGSLAVTRGTQTLLKASRRNQLLLTPLNLDF